jgi:hypothetical protein
VSKYNPLEFERWRKLMLGGALVLLFTTILQAADVIETGILYAIGLGAGYMLLAFGFSDSFRSRRKRAEEAAAAKMKTEEEPPVNGS